ncbi:MAG: Outer membrane lipoprotein Blc precursor [Elusimicrobia bacterium ADurb.Bin231]|nr:MAG: Outer membrane lipoprotein Blc precursor [Elusimicrobia bacterium ADurb.Bin231]
MKIKQSVYLLFIFAVMAGLSSCSTIPKGASAVKPFHKEKYLGKWYEIARKDFKYERNLSNTTAEYSLNDDGSVKVDNQGYHTIKGKWAQAIGKAKFIGEEDIAKLKVSFFGPFYSGYNVIAIDDEYRYALVAGKSLKYLWILSREIHIPVEIKDKYLKIAENIGYNTADLIWVEHNKNKTCAVSFALSKMTILRGAPKDWT